jgi:hypothetical protein
LGELALGLAQPLTRRKQPGVGALECRGAGADLEQAQLLGRQRRLLVGVVLAARMSGSSWNFDGDLPG